MINDMCDALTIGRRRGRPTVLRSTMFAVMMMDTIRGKSGVVVAWLAKFIVSLFVVVGCVEAKCAVSWGIDGGNVWKTMMK